MLKFSFSDILWSSSSMLGICPKEMQRYVQEFDTFAEKGERMESTQWKGVNTVRLWFQSLNKVYKHR